MGTSTCLALLASVTTSLRLLLPTSTNSTLSQTGPSGMSASEEMKACHVMLLWCLVSTPVGAGIVTFGNLEPMGASASSAGKLQPQCNTLCLSALPVDFLDCVSRALHLRCARRPGIL